MPHRRPPKPTPAEHAILRVLWRRGRCTVREVLDELNASRPAGAPAGYTTILKLLQIMTAKGLVRRDESQRTHAFEAATNEEQTQRHLVKEMLDRVFNGSARKLVLHALSAHRATPQEIAEIRALLDRIEKEDKTAEPQAAKPQPGKGGAAR